MLARFLGRNTRLPAAVPRRRRVAAAAAAAASSASSSSSALGRALAAGRAGHGDDAPGVILVTGASRGLGLAFARHFLLGNNNSNNNRVRVVAAARGGPDDPGDGLAALAREVDDPSRLHVAALDVERPDSIEACAAAVQASHGRVDVLLNVAGLLHDADHMPERKLDQVEQDWLLRSMAVNAAGPLLMAKAFAPLLRRDRQDLATSLICNLSARVGSLGDNGLGGWYSYRMSKAALNMATVNLSIELKRQGTQVVSMHPGTCRTGLSAPFQKNVAKGKLFEPEFAVAEMARVLGNLPPDATGKALAWDGQEIEW